MSAMLDAICAGVAPTRMLPELHLEGDQVRVVSDNAFTLRLALAGCHIIAQVFDNRVLWQEMQPPLVGSLMVDLTSPDSLDVLSFFITENTEDKSAAL